MSTPKSCIFAVWGANWVNGPVTKNSEILLKYPTLEVFLAARIKFFKLRVYNRRLGGSTDQACSSGFYFRIALKSTGTTLFSSKSFPLISAGPQKPQKLTASKIKYEKFGPKILIPH